MTHISNLSRKKIIRAIIIFSILGATSGEIFLGRYPNPIIHVFYLAAVYVLIFYLYLKITKDLDKRSASINEALTEIMKQSLQVNQTSIFEHVLESLLKLTNSEYGFIGEVHVNDNGEKYLQTHAITDIAWNEETKSLYRSKGMIFTNLDTLFGTALKNEAIVISNNPSKDPRASGIPKGHPSLDTFIGIPIFSDGKMIGLIGLANKPDGYSRAIVEDLHPLLVVCENEMEKERKFSNLQARDALFDIFFDVSDDYLTVANFKKATIEKVSKGFCELTGYEANEIEGERWKKFTTGIPEDKQFPTYLVSKSQYVKITTDTKMLGKNGDYIALRSTFYPIYVSGELEALIGIHIDVKAESFEKYNAQLSNARFEQFVVSSRDPSFMYIAKDNQYIHDFSNESFRNLITYELEDSKIEDFYKSIHEDSLEDFSKGIEQAKLGNFQTGIQTRIIIDQKDVYLAFSLTPIFDDTGQIYAISGTAIDITNERLTEIKAWELTKRFENAVEYMSDCFILTDGQAKILEINKNTTEILGYQEDELRGENITILMNEENAEVHKVRFANIEKLDLQVGVVVASPKVDVKCKDGHFIPMEIKSSKFISNGEIYFSVMLHDQRDYVEALERLQKTSAEAKVLANQYKDILDSEELFIFGIDSANSIRFWGKAAELKTGFIQNEVLGKNVKDIIPTNSQVSFTENSKIYGRIFQTRMNSSEKHELSLLLATYSVELEGQHLTMYIGLDNTKLKEQEKILQSAAKSESLAILTGGVAHDFNNILAVIFASLEYISMDSHKKATNEALEDAMSAARNGAKLASDLLSFARKNSLTEEYFDLVEFIDQNKRLLALSLGSEAELNIVNDVNTAFVYLDKEELLSALINILRNSRDAKNKNDILRVNLTISLPSNENILFLPTSAIKNFSASSFIRLDIADNGTGIHENDINKIFEPFFSSKEVGKGTGLGLSRVMGFCEQSGGFVIAANAPDGGFIISLFFPKNMGNKNNAISKRTNKLNSYDNDILSASPYQSTVFPVSVKSNITSLQAYTIEGASELSVLVVEDDVLLKKTTVRNLEVMGFIVSSASNVDEALDFLENKKHIDIVFTDIMMPGAFSGHDLVEIIRRYYPKTKVALTTGYDEHGNTSHKNEIPMLAKPYHLEQLRIFFAGLIKNNHKK